MDRAISFIKKHLGDVHYTYVDNSHTTSEVPSYIEDGDMTTIDTFGFIIDGKEVDICIPRGEILKKETRADIRKDFHELYIGNKRVLISLEVGK